MGSDTTHKGHRERLKQRFLTEGLDHFTDIQALELLLFYAIPQKDTNPIAHALLDRFGSISQVMNAKAEELVKVPGISTHSALLLTLIPQLVRFYQVDDVRKTGQLLSLEACCNYLAPFFFGRITEVVYVLCLDAKCKVICCKEVGQGNVNSASISIRKIVEIALHANATTVILAHNHPGGIAMPSEEDVRTTCRLAAALNAMEIHLADHIVVADGEYVSMLQSGYQFQNPAYL